jgi:hypothetical protein
LTRPFAFPFKRLIAMMCMALAVMLSGQTFISLMDRIEHTHDHQHFANPLAGGVEYSDHANRSHHHDGGQPAYEGSRGPAHQHVHDQAAAKASTPEPTADHQHSDATVLYLAAQDFILPDCPVPTELCGTLTPKLASFSPRGPDHPPKTDLQRRL